MTEELNTKTAPANWHLVHKPQLLRLLGVSLSTLNNWVAKGHFPKPIQLGPRAVAWRSDVVEAFIESRPTAGGVL
jgi:predicted DNA-binding transcriptional regulator AlpA